MFPIEPDKQDTWCLHLTASKMGIVAAVMVFHNHTRKDLDCVEPSQCLFNFSMKIGGRFQLVEFNAKDKDGVYLCFCCETGRFIRVGMCAFRSMFERDEEHSKNALLGTSEALKSKFHRSYPRTQSIDKVRSSRKGTFERLDQLVVLSQKLDQSVSSMLGVFKIDENDNKQINKLNFRMRGGKQPSLADKQRRSIYYILELCHGPLLAPSNNISSNPGWEQGLRQHGN